MPRVLVLAKCIEHLRVFNLLFISHMACTVFVFTLL